MEPSAVELIYAVIDVKLDRGVSMWSWKAVKGTGTAIAWEDSGAEAPAAS